MKNVAIIGVIIVLVIAGILLLQGTDDTSTVVDVVETTEVQEPVVEMDTTMEVEEVETTPDIVTTAVNTPSLSTLVAAVTAGELVPTLQSEGPFTVFAPTNEAFGALPEGTLETLLEPANLAQLQSILTYHVVPGAVTAGDLTDGMIIETVNGESITIGVTDAGVTINGSATVTMADVMTSNGVVHVIDSVLLPPTE